MTKNDKLRANHTASYLKMNRIKTAVIGVGYLGKFHVEKYATLPHSQLVAICDIHSENSQLLSEKYHRYFHPFVAGIGSDL